MQDNSMTLIYEEEKMNLTKISSLICYKISGLLSKQRKRRQKKEILYSDSNKIIEVSGDPEVLIRLKKAQEDYMNKTKDSDKV